MNNDFQNQFAGRQRPNNQNMVGRQTRVPVNSALCSNLQKKSLDKRPMTVQERKKYLAHKKLKDMLKKITCAFVTSAVVAVSAVSMVNTFNKEKELRDVYSEATHIVSENTHRTEDFQHYWIDYYKVAEGLATLEGDFNINIYGVYESVGWDNESTIEQMNKIVGYCNGLEITNYTDFEDLCRQNGFCTEDGKPDLKKYQKAMREYLENAITISKAENKNSEIMPQNEENTMKF